MVNTLNTTVSKSVSHIAQWQNGGDLPSKCHVNETVMYLKALIN